MLRTARTITIGIAALLAGVVAALPAQAAPTAPTPLTSSSKVPGGLGPSANGSAAPAAPLAATWPWVNYGSKKCLGVLSGNMTNGTPVIQWTCNGQPDQQWYQMPLNGSVQELRPLANPLKCIGVQGGSLGSRAVILDCNGSWTQKWAATYDPSTSCYRLWNAYYGTLLLDIVGGGGANGAPAGLWEELNVFQHPDQEWC